MSPAEKKRARFLAWHANNPHKAKEYARKAYNADPGKARKKACANRVKFAAYYKQYWKEYRKKRYANNAIARLSDILRSRLSAAMSGKVKNGSGVRDLGCSIEYFIVYIKKMFEDGMGWDNKGKWHIDHIKPLSSFDLTDRAQLLQACNYTNLQPLWAKDNIAKGARLDFPLRSALNSKRLTTSPCADSAQPVPTEATHVRP